MRTRILATSKREDLLWWHILQVYNRPKQLLLNHNWCKDESQGCPKVGEEVAFEVAKVPTYSSVPEYDFVHEFRRISKEQAEESVS